MKKALAVLLALLMLAAVPMPLTAQTTGQTNAGDTPAVLAEKDALPPAVDLWGTSAIPPVDNQGGIGSCVSEAVTYMQFTNAIAKYMNAVNPDVKWDPSSGDKQYIFSPQYTYVLSGAGTQWVYNVLQDNGCLPLIDGGFFKSSDGGSQYKDSTGALYKESVKWNTGDLMKKALGFRIKTYEQIWISQGDYIDGKTSYNDPNILITTTDKGKALLTKIKDAVANGNVVVTGGIIGRWLTGYLTGDGTIGKAGEPAIIAGAGNGGGGHQVAIVGYDDNIECTIGGVTMKGGFKVVNSWGPSWGKDGYEWLMYDALNTTSEHEEFNKPGFYSGDMFLDSVDGDKVVMNPSYSATGDQTVTFTKMGTVTVNGKSYPTYNLYSKALGGYLTYNGVGNNSVTVSSIPGSYTEWALIPYEDMTSWSATAANNKDDSYKGSYWIYAVNRGNIGYTDYRYLDAGLSVQSAGRSVGIASHNGGAYPQAKSWYVSSVTDTAKFTAQVGIWAGRGTSSNRSYTMDQMIFVYWDKDITLEMPELYIAVDVTTKNRESIYLQMVRHQIGSAASTNRVTQTPASIDHRSVHPNFDKGGWDTKGNTINFSGEFKGGEETATLYYSFSDLLYNLPEGKTLADYEWGVRFGACRSESVTYKNVRLLSQDGTVLSTLDLGEDGITVTGRYASTSVTYESTTTTAASYHYFDKLPDSEYKVTTKLADGLLYKEVSTAPYHYGNTLSFQITAADGYELHNLTVLKNGTPILPVDGVYTTTVCGNVEIQANGVWKVGDIHHDGEITIADATALLVYLETPEIADEEEILPIADVNADGILSVKDLSRLLAHLKDSSIPLYRNKT